MENSNLFSYPVPLLTPTESQEDERPAPLQALTFSGFCEFLSPCLVTPHQHPSFLHNIFSLPYPRCLPQIAWSVLPSCKSTRAAVLLYPFQRLFLSAQLQLLLLVVVVVRPTTPMQDQGPYYYYYLCCQRSEEGQLNDSPLWSPASTPLGCAAAGHETGPLTQHARPKPCSPVPGQSDSYHPFYYLASHEWSPALLPRTEQFQNQCATTAL